MIKNGAAAATGESNHDVHATEVGPTPKMFRDSFVWFVVERN